jgi:putative SOS response-associated peptidase YedK
MCGRYGYSVEDAQEVYSRFQIASGFAPIASHFNVTPATVNPVVTRHSPNTISMMFWGLIPYFAQPGDTKKYRTINAVSETVMEKPSFRKPFQFQRCLVPVSFFYEWDKATKPSTPYLFRLKDASLFAFAGLYNVWQDPRTGQEIPSYTILTTTPNSLIENIHNRMPVILRREDEGEWLNPDLTEPEQIYELIHPYPADEMETYPVSRHVNVPSYDAPDLIERVGSQ